MNQWYMLTVVGADRPGIVARLTGALFAGGCHLGEAAMMRLGGNFSIMLMVRTDTDLAALEALVRPVADELALRIHADAIEGALHQHIEPDVRITVHGADRAGIVAQVTGALAEAGLNILELESDVGGSAEAPIYVMSIEGQAGQGIEALETALKGLADSGIDVRIAPLDTLIG